MKDIPNIVEYVTDPQLLNLAISEPQETLLRAIYGLPLSDHQLEIWTLCTGRKDYPRHGFSETTILVGARGGKDSRIACPIASYEAALGGHDKHLARGERAIVPLVAQDSRGTRIAFGYLKSHFTESPILKALLEDEPTQNEIRLINRAGIICFPSTAPSVRGWSIPVALMDEVGFWRLEGSADSDVEIQAAIRRGMINFDSTRLIKISTPYMRSGVLYDDFKNHFGKDSPDVLVWRAGSAFMNPVLKEARLEREKRLDPVRFSREYEAEFAEDLEAFLPSAWVEQAIIHDRRELAPAPGVPYTAAVDSTGLSDAPTADVFALCIGHREGDVFVQDVCRGWKKQKQQSMDLGSIVDEIAAILQRYGLNDVRGDKYSGQWVIEAFRKAGLTYLQTEFDKSHFYLEMHPLFAQGKIEILDHAEQERELKSLERRPRQGGKTLIDHPRGRHDDYSNALAITVVHSAETLKAARGFSSAHHVSRQRLKFIQGSWPLIIGLSHDNGFTATTVAQAYDQELRVFFSHVSQGTSLHRHLEHTKSWLVGNAPRLMLLGAVEDLPDKETKIELFREAETVLSGAWLSIVKRWEPRRDAMLDALGKAVPYSFKPALMFDPVDARPIIEALSGRWSFSEKDQRDLRNASWYAVDSLSLVVARCELWKNREKSEQPLRLPPSFMSA